MEDEKHSWKNVLSEPAIHIPTPIKIVVTDKDGSNIEFRITGAALKTLLYQITKPTLVK